MSTAEQVIKPKTNHLFMAIVGKILQPDRVRGIIANALSDLSIPEHHQKFLEIAPILKERIVRLEENIAEIASQLINIGKLNFDLILRSALEQPTLKKALNMFPNELSKDKINILFQPVWKFKKQIKVITEKRLGELSDLTKFVFKLN